MIAFAGAKSVVLAARAIVALASSLTVARIFIPQFSQDGFYVVDVESFFTLESCQQFRA